MRITLAVILVSVTASACSSEPVDTKEECLESGGHVIESSGGKVTCPDGEEEIGRIPGFEPIICCR
jgi:hypothetical protein